MSSATFDQAVALVDERYLNWLAAQHGGQGSKTVQRGALMPVLSNLVRLCGPDVHLLRTCLFTDKAPTELHDDVLPRLVPQHAVDGGLGMVRALGQELTQIAQRGACGLVLLATDDERLIPYIDEAQWRGVKVVLIADEVSQDHGKLMSEDPSWARLLMQADRRLAFNEQAWQSLTGAAPAGYFASRVGETAPEDQVSEESMSNGPPSDDWRSQVEDVIQTWWAEETPDARLDLYEEMHGSQGVPPETDRHLLLRVRREMGRTLSFPEKKAMREMIRSTVLAQRPEIDESLSA